MTTSVEEQETTIVIERAQSMCRVYTCDDTFKTKMKNAGHEPNRTEGDGLFYEVPKNTIIIRSASALKNKRILTPEQRKATGARLKAARLKNNAGGQARKD